jgi:hypothetical protein
VRPHLRRRCRQLYCSRATQESRRSESGADASQRPACRRRSSRTVSAVSPHWQVHGARLFITSGGSAENGDAHMDAQQEHTSQQSKGGGCGEQVRAAARAHETHTHRRGAGLSFARAQACKQMTAHGYTSQEQQPAGNVKGGNTSFSGERRRTKPTHTCMLSKKHTSQQAKGGGCGEQVRAAARSHLGVTWR